MIFTRRETALLLGGDFLLLGISLWLALLIRTLRIPTPGYYAEHLQAFSVIFAISILIFFIAGLYEKRTRLVKSLLISRIFGAQVVNTIIAALLFFLVPFTIAPKTILILYLLISVSLISAWRFLAVPYFSLSIRQKAVVIGTGEAVTELYDEVNRHRKYYVHFTELIDTSGVLAEDIAPTVLTAIKEGVQLVVLDTRDERVRSELTKLYDAMLGGVTFAEFSVFYEDVFDRIPVEHIDHAWLLECLPKQHLGYGIGKWIFDRIGAFIGVVCATVFVAPAALVLQITGGHPFIFSERIGRGGKIIRLIKLRTMLFFDNGDPELQKKNKVTRFGWFLRKTRIDELPQLLNVLIGELSFIGPRPELPKIAQVYEKEIPFYEARHLITPGLSGWAQIHDYDAPRGPADVERTRRKLSFDLYYLKRRSFMLDIVISLKTLRALASLSGN